MKVLLRKSFRVIFLELNELEFFEIKYLRKKQQTYEAEHSELCQTSKKKLFAKIGNGFQLFLTVFRKDFQKKLNLRLTVF